MGLFFSKLYQLFEEWGNTPARILMLGLDAAGKYCFKFEFFVVFFLQNVDLILQWAAPII